MIHAVYRFWAWLLSWPNDSAGLVSVLGYAGVIGTLFHHLNCHEPRCWRPARHQTGGYCRKHAKGHPDGSR